MANKKKRIGDADVMGGAVSEAGEAVRRRQENLVRAKLNRAMLEERPETQQGGDTPEFGRFASRPKGKTRKGKPKPAKIAPLEAGREYDTDEGWKFGRDKAAIAARKRAKKRGVVSQRYLNQENGGKARGGSVGGPKRKGYANGGSVRAARF